MIHKINQTRKQQKKYHLHYIILNKVCGRGRPQNRFLDVVKEMLSVGATGDDVG